MKRLYEKYRREEINEDEFNKLFHIIYDRTLTLKERREINRDILNFLIPAKYLPVASEQLKKKEVVDVVMNHIIKKEQGKLKEKLIARKITLEDFDKYKPSIDKDEFNKEVTSRMMNIVKFPYFEIDIEDPEIYCWK